MRKGAKVLVSLGMVVAFLFFSGPQILRSQSAAKGNLIGFVYEQDGATPIEGAVVVIKNVTTGLTLQSGKSDRLGVFKVEGLDSGIYALGVSSPQGDFNGQDFIGIAPNSTAKISLALNPYEEPVAAAAQQVAKDQQEAGLSRIGRVVNYYPDKNLAEVYIERGLLQLGDKILVKGDVTNFNQETRTLFLGQNEIRKALAGQTIFLPVIKPAIVGDIVYIACKRGIPPIFLPLGVAAISGLAGAVTLTEEEPGSVFKNKK